jgi:hypothetical protein
VRKLQDQVEPSTSISGLWQFCPPSLNACQPSVLDVIAPTAVDCTAALAPGFSQLSLTNAQNTTSILGSLVYNLGGDAAEFQSSSVIGQINDVFDISLVTPGIPGVWGGNISAVLDPSSKYFTFPVTLPSNDTFQACWLRVTN